MHTRLLPSSPKMPRSAVPVLALSITDVAMVTKRFDERQSCHVLQVLWCWNTRQCLHRGHPWCSKLMHVTGNGFYPMCVFGLVTRQVCPGLTWCEAISKTVDVTWLDADEFALCQLAVTSCELHRTAGVMQVFWLALDVAYAAIPPLTCQINLQAVDPEIQQAILVIFA